MSDQHISETVSDLTISRGAPSTVGTNAISVHQENVSGATGSIESAEAASGSPNTEDSSTRISLTASKVSVTSWTIAKESMDSGLLFSRSQSDEENKLAERDLLQRRQKRRTEDKEIQYGSEQTFCLELLIDSFIAQDANTELVAVLDNLRDKRLFERWLQWMHFYLSSTKLINRDEKFLKCFLLSQLKPESPPFNAILFERRRRSKVNIKPLTLFEEMILIHEEYEERKKLVVFKKATYWLTWDALYNQLKLKESGTLSKGREFKDKPRNCTKLYERTKSEERKRTSGWTQKVQANSLTVYLRMKALTIHKSGERSPDFHKFMSGNDFSDMQKFKSSFEDSKSVEFLNSNTNLFKFEPKSNQGQYLAKEPSKNPGTVSSNIDIENQMEQSEDGRTLKVEQKESEEKTSKETNMKAENEELTLSESVGQLTFSDLVMEEQPAFIREQLLADQETDTGLSPSSDPVSELLTSSQSPTILSEEDRKWLFKERISE